MAKIKDMGEYIPGSKKELWGLGKIDIEDLALMSEGDKEKFIKRDVLFPAPDYKKMVQEDGVPAWIALFISKVRALIVKATPKYESMEDYIDGVKAVKEALEGIRTEEDFDNFRKRDLCEIAGGQSRGKVIYKKPYYNTAFKVRYASKIRLEHEAKNKCFGATQDQKKAKAILDETNKYKITLNTPDSVKVEDHRMGRKKLTLSHPGCKYFIYDEEYLDASLFVEGTYHILYYDKNAKKNTIIKTSVATMEEASKIVAEIVAKKFVEEETKPRTGKKNFSVCTQNVTRNGYDYVADLNAHLGIREEKNGQLSLFYDDDPEYHPNEEDFSKEFGFRGIQFGNWESDNDRRENLKWLYNSCKDQASILNIEEKDISLGGRLAVAFGARGSKGAAAHYEPGYKVINLTKMNGAGCWIHEWAHALDNYLGSFIDQKYASETSMWYNDVYSELMRAIKGGTYSETEYYRDSKKFDELYKKSGNGYWSSDCELFARAFDCYFVDKMKKAGMVNTFLSAHAESFTTFFEGKTIYAYPRGAEREKINECFDKMLEDVFNRGILHLHESRTAA